MRLSYAISTMIFWWRENRLSFEQECQYLKSMGFGIELWPNTGSLDECRYDRRNWSRLSAATEDMLVVMRSRNDYPTLEQWAEQIQCARMLDASIVADLQSMGIAENGEPCDFGFASDIMKMADENDVKIALETGDLAKVMQAGERLDTLSYCLDTGRANLDKAFGFRRYVEELTPRITNLHLNDNYGKSDDHLPPGLRGGIQRKNWDYLLEQLDGHDNNIIATFEMSPPMPTVMIRQAEEFMFKKLGWPGRPQKASVRARAVYNPR
jgi:sugar phosphate isomerase/epimerase